MTATRDIYDGNGFVALANSPTEDGNGWYNLTLAASDLNAPVVALRLTASGCDPVNLTLMTPMIKFPINPQTPRPAGGQAVSYAVPAAAMTPTVATSTPTYPCGSAVLRPVGLPTIAMIGRLE